MEVPRLRRAGIPGEGTKSRTLYGAELGIEVRHGINPWCPAFIPWRFLLGTHFRKSKDLKFNAPSLALAGGEKKVIE